MHTNSFDSNKNHDEIIIIRGVKYLIPDNSSLYHKLTLRQLILNFNGRNVDTGADIPILSLDSLEDKVSALSLHIRSEHCIASDTNFKVVFYLYREGVERPIITFEDYVDTEYGSVLTAEDNDVDFSPGRYFLVGDNVSGAPDTALVDSLHDRLCYAFEVLHSGAGLRHPQIEHVNIHRKNNDVQAGLYTSGALRLYFQLTTSLVEKSELRAACYSQDWTLISTGTCYHPHGCNAHDRVGVTLRSERIWSAGEYFVVLSHNCEPFVLFQFNFNGAAVTECSVRQLCASDTEYMLVKRVETDKDLKWYNVDCLPGMASVKPSLIRAFCRKDFDALCMEYNLPLLRSHRYAVITSPIFLTSGILVSELPYLLHFGTLETNTISCQRYSVEDIYETFEEEKENTIALCDISALVGDKLKAIEAIMQNRSSVCHIIFLGNEDELVKLCNSSHIISEALADSPRFDLTWPSVAETLETFRSEIQEKGFVFTSEAEDALAKQVMLHHTQLCRWEKKERECYIQTDVAQRVRSRVQGCIDDGKEFSPKRVLMLHSADIDISSYLAALTEKEATLIDDNLFYKSMEQLNKMVGLATLKSQLAATFALVRFQESRRRLGLPADWGTTHHMLFTGNPGTGKTTVARLIGKIYHAMGYLSKGEVICTDRTELVGSHIGHTEQNMTKILRKAKGNVLFIDEAYTLCDSTEDRKDFGYHVIEALLPVMAEPNSDLIVIFAGYADEMERLMKANQGLKGRFAHHLHFEDYTADELMQICDNLLREYQYVLTGDACMHLRDVVTRTLQCRDPYFCNARWMKQFIESGILPAMARRTMLHPQKKLDISMLSTIELSDVEEAACVYAPKQPQIQLRPRIGFVA